MDSSDVELETWGKLDGLSVLSVGLANPTERTESQSRGNQKLDIREVGIS